jgi:transposase
MTKQDLNDWMMYHEIHKMKRVGFSIRKISQDLVMNFRTVKKYLDMSEDVFFQHLENKGHRYKKLIPYEEFTKEKLNLYPQTGSAQMHDWLKENFEKFPKICPKTVYNFVMYIRQKYNIPQQGISREFFPVEELAYGKQAQVDFGESSLRKRDGGRKKVFFFSMVLSRSRFKFVHFEEQPFTTQLAIQAHEKAFAFMQGIPQEIVYDQDKVFIHGENAGDYLLTKEFKNYTSIRGFHLHFCRKADPQSKGKIENVVKYVKQNFLFNRTFIDIDTLNDQSDAWLLRTANIMLHNRTLKIPFYEWHTERNYLKQFTPLPIQDNPFKSYNVMKDNTIRFKGNIYTLPQGTYQSKSTSVLIRVQENTLNIFNLQQELICSHTISLQKGLVISNTDHKRDKSKKIDELIQQISACFIKPEKVKIYLENIRKEKPRYIRDQIAILLKTIDLQGHDIVFTGIEYCLEKQIFTVTDLNSIIENIKAQNKQVNTLSQEVIKPLPECMETLKKAHIEPSRSNIDDYEKIVLN